MLQDFGDTKVLKDPTKEELQAHFAPHVVERILGRLGNDKTKGEFKLTRVLTVTFTPFTILVNYKSERPDGKMGTEFVNLRYFTSQMRALVITASGQVVQIQEHRPKRERPENRWVIMNPAGGDKKGKPLEVMASEIAAETGCKLIAGQTKIYHLATVQADDGIAGDLLELYVVTGVEAPASHVNPEDGIKGIVITPFAQWRERALDRKTGDHWDTSFAASVSEERFGGTTFFKVRGALSIITYGG